MKRKDHRPMMRDIDAEIHAEIVEGPRQMKKGVKLLSRYAVPFQVSCDADVLRKIRSDLAN